MKKIYMLASAMIIGTTGMSQFSTSLVATKSETNPTHQSQTNGVERAPGDIIGTVMDFSNPADWVMAETGTPSGMNWVIGTAGPTGGFSGGMGPIASTSGGNFALFDSDAIGDGASAQDATITMANSIDLTGLFNVAVEFESYYRNFQGNCFLEISTDGVAYTQYPVHELVLLNESSANPELVSVNISAIASNQATVWARFRYIGGWDYAWMIDDVAFVEGYDDNLILNESYMYGGQDSLDYYMIPFSQISSFNFESFVTNGGLNDQTNSVMTVNVNDGTSDIYTEVSAAQTIPAFTGSYFSVGPPSWTPPGTGNYVVTYNMGSDGAEQSVDDNSDTLESILVGGNIYARDNGIATGSVGYLGGTPVHTVCANEFEFFNTFNLGKIHVGISSTSVPGEQIFAEIRIYDAGLQEFVYVEGSDDYTIQSGDPGNVIELTLNSIVTCSAGEFYMIGAGHYGSADVRFLEGQTAPGAVIYNDGAASQQNSVFIIRGEEVFVGLDEENVATGLTVYPNPTTDNIFLSYNLANSANVTLVITDISGKVVMDQDFGTQEQGSYKTNLNTGDFSNGVYFYTLTVDGNSQTKKFVVSGK